MLFILSLMFFQSQKASAQLPTLTVTITDATNCIAPCNGQASVPVISGATYSWNTTPPQTTATATGLCPGTYSVTATLAPFGSTGGSGTVACATGIQENGMSTFINVFPNPASENITISFTYPNGGAVNEVSVFNSIGEKVLTQNIASKKLSNKLFVGNLPTGVYFLVLKDEKNSYRTKFIKE